MPEAESSQENPFAVLGIEVAGGRISDEELRARYTQLVKENPPERNPQAFRRIRRAYEDIRTPAARVRQALQYPEPPPPHPEGATGPPGLLSISPAWWLMADPWSELGQRDFSADCRPADKYVVQKKLFDLPGGQTQEDT